MRNARIHHRRFFVPAECIREGWVEFAPGQARQIVQVLRLRRGEQVAVFDGTGREVIASLEAATARRARARILVEAPRLPWPRLRITLAQVVPRGMAMDLIVAKATELGVARIVPLEGERSVRRAAGREPRWVRVARESAEQCGRRDVPELAPLSSLEEFLREHPPGIPLLVCEAGEGDRPLAEVCRDLGDVASLGLLVGGEGGLSPGEIERLRSRNAILVSLGPRLLRADTAALTALAVLQALLGDWESKASEMTGND